MATSSLRNPFDRVKPVRRGGRRHTVVNAPALPPPAAPTSPPLPSPRQPRRPSSPPQAGKRFQGRDESVAYCLNDGPPEAPLPPRVARFREREVPVGARAPHPGFRGDPSRADAVHGDYFKGVATTSADVMDTRETPVAALITAKAEARVYASVGREPLGRRSAGFQSLPADVSAPGRSFGAKTAASAGSAKERVFPPEPDAGDEAREPVYRVSHRSYPPGVQRRDRVRWELTGVEPSSFKFGRPMVSTETNVVGKCLNPTLDGAPAARAGAPGATRLVPKVIADARAVSGYALGKTRGRDVLDAAGHPAVYGKASARSTAGEWGTADCLRGDFTREEQEPDRDLGRATTPGFRNAGFADAGRRFGLPSVRTDVPPRVDSVAGTTDYGTGPSSAALLFPSPYAASGVDAADFTAPRPPAELRELWARAGYAMSDAEWAAVLARAAADTALTRAGEASLADVRAALNEVLDARDAGEEPAWFTQAVDGAGGAAEAAGGVGGGGAGRDAPR